MSPQTYGVSNSVNYMNTSMLQRGMNFHYLLATLTRSSISKPNLRHHVAADSVHFGLIFPKTSGKSNHGGVKCVNVTFGWTATNLNSNLSVCFRCILKRSLIISLRERALGLKENSTESHCQENKSCSKGEGQNGAGGCQLSSWPHRLHKQAKATT